jgi:hypothetical protein
MLIWSRVVCASTVYHLTHLVVHVFPSHLGAGIWHPVSSFNVKWRCSAQAGVVEESKFCLFLVVFPVRCVSSVSPRFYFRRLTFCFLPLAAIFDSLKTVTSNSRQMAFYQVSMFSFPDLLGKLLLFTFFFIK